MGERGVRTLVLIYIKLGGNFFGVILGTAIKPKPEDGLPMYLVILNLLICQSVELSLVDVLQDPLKDLDRTGIVIEQLQDLETRCVLVDGLLHGVVLVLAAPALGEPSQEACGSNPCIIKRVKLTRP